ncbi:MAG: amino acid ABC transporter permease [Alicyclobacillus herbarius]|uniref:amino acid ABC transporter permease n=1 Tax=Alicyclobacillus herbarius TaxID=122960 RepID=UPI00235473BE|nr:amino acid ABC transporter permease [Alicyclobacillus herbarius]MCL6633330.1 amino acid ABC transporter permease [Alicyclobacillus herbarius]
MRIVLQYLAPIAHGMLVTIELTILSTVAALLIGILGALLRLYAPTPMRAIVTAYVEVVRGTPQILQLFVIFFGLMQYGINLDSFTAAAIWLSGYGGAYAIELFRAGIQSIPNEQREAAAALGISRSLSFRRIVLPQAVATILPALVNFLVLQVKNSSLAFTIGAMDIMRRAELGVDATNHATSLYLMAVIAYFILNFPLSRLGVLLERRIAQYR